MKAARFFRFFRQRKDKAKQRCPKFPLLNGLELAQGGAGGRWQKTFDELKNKLGETKAWASSADAKAMPADFLCLAHSLIRPAEKRQTTLAPAVRDH